MHAERLRALLAQRRRLLGSRSQFEDFSRAITDVFFLLHDLSQFGSVARYICNTLQIALSNARLSLGVLACCGNSKLITFGSVIYLN